MPSVEPEVVLSLSMVSQLKEELARDLRMIVREELWRPLTEGPAGQLAPAVSVGQLAVQAFNETLKGQKPPEVGVSASPQNGMGGGLEDDAQEPSRRRSSRASTLAEKENELEFFKDRMADQENVKADHIESELWTMLMDKAPCCRPCLTSISRWYNLLGTLEAPPRPDPLSKFADSKLFTTLVHVVILLNSMFMFYAAEEEISHYDGELPEQVAMGEQFFLVAYSTEFVVKLWRYHWSYFFDSSWKYNWLDLFLLFLSTYSVFFEDNLPNFSWLRMMRMLRLFKVVRVLRLIAVVKPLRAILKSLFNTLGTLFWSLTLLALILGLFALVFVLRVATYLRNERDVVDEVVEERLLEFYGGVTTTFHHLFEATTGGNDWSIYYRPLVETGFINCGIFYFFVAFTQIAVLNIILGVFVDTAMKSMTGNREELMQEFADQQKQMESDLREMCICADADKDGKLSEAEWKAALKDNRMITYLETMGWRLSEMRDLIYLMGSGAEDHGVDIDTFVRSSMRFKGAASCFDMQVVLNAVKDVKREVRTAKQASRF